MRSVRRQVPNRCPTAQQQPWRSAIRWRLAVRQGAGRRGRYGRGGAREGGQLTALGEQTRAGRAWGHGAAGAPPEAPDDAHHMALVRREQLSADRAALGRFYHGCRSICRWCLRHGVAKESGGAALVEARRSSATTWPWFGASSRRKVRGHGSAGRRATEVRQPRTEVRQPSTEVRQPSTRRHVSRHAAASEGANRMAMVQREQPVEDLETPGRPGTAVALQRSQEARREPPRSSAGRRASHGHGAAQAVVGRSRARGQLCAGRCLMSVPLNAALHLFSNSEPPRSCHTAAPRREIVLLLNGGMGLLLASPPRLSAPSWLHPRQAAAESNAA